ncbi:MAG: hypothetical protein IIC74_12470 [Bacteroidetes bacterium]|nr:hypothetical protein [Bacteroidota bacterium]
MKLNLNNIKNTGFKTPDNYFDAIEDVIINKIETKNTTKVIPLFSRRNLIYASSIAAAVLLLFNLSIFDKEITWDSLDTQTVENYIINEGIDSYEIAALLFEDDLTEDLFIQNTITVESLETYILENTSIEDILIE